MAAICGDSPLIHMNKLRTPLVNLLKIKDQNIYVLRQKPQCISNLHISIDMILFEPVEIPND